MLRHWDHSNRWEVQLTLDVGQSGGDGVEVAVQPGGERAQGGGAVGVDPLHPAMEFVAAAAGQDLGELADLVTGGNPATRSHRW